MSTLLVTGNADSGRRVLKVFNRTTGEELPYLKKVIFDDDPNTDLKLAVHETGKSKFVLVSNSNKMRVVIVSVGRNTLTLKKGFSDTPSTVAVESSGRFEK
ncbi:MAG: hypothetical protein IPM82_11960 [Saprospiraceae bacterium]|nr:hypothetical protein [Saprospiraceae bacterium]